jgi:HSP20 family protein
MGNILRKIAGMDGGKNLPMEEEENLYENYQSEDNEMSEEEPAKENEWLEDGFEEGQLSIDVYQTPTAIVVKSTIAGVSSDDIDISINNDMLTIRGKREQTEKIRDEDYLYRECYWGSFSRSIILPVEVEPEKVDASLENGVLTVVLPKAKTSKQISIKVKNK